MINADVARPRLDRGVDHETLGASMLAVDDVLRSFSGSKTGKIRILGPTGVQRLEGIEPDRWYPGSWLLEMMDSIDAVIGQFGLIKLGRVMFQRVHQSRLERELRCGRDVVYGVGDMHQHLNRGADIGGWHVLSFDESSAQLESTTPLHCMMEEGLLSEALKAAEAPAVVTQERCTRKGSHTCVFRIEPNLALCNWESSRW